MQKGKNMAWRTENTKENLFIALDVCDEVIVFDTETTGLSANKNHIIQISAQKFKIENGEFVEIARLNRYINPGYSLPPKITEVTGITDDMLIKEEYEEDVFPEIYEFFNDAQCVAGYNVAFDVRFITAMYERQGKTFDPDFIVDVLESARDLVSKKEVENHKLGTIAALYGVDDDLTFHNSMDDVIATSRLMMVFLTEYNNIKSSSVLNKKVAKVYSLSYYKGYRGFSRIYVNTNLGSFYYDIRNKNWGVGPKNLHKVEEVDMEQLRKDAFKLANVTTEMEFARYKG